MEMSLGRIILNFREIDFSQLTKFEYSLKEENISLDVLNGIAYDKLNDAFYITGKLWSHIYYLKFKFKS
jgi:glutamine cyclotransferase